MRRNLPIRGILAGMFVLALGFAWPVFAEEKGGSSATDEGLFRVALRNGQEIEGTLTTSPLQLKTEFLTLVIEKEYVQRISFQPPEADHVDVTVELRDRSHQHGRLTTPELVFKALDGEKRLRAAEIREIRSVQKKKANLWAILLGLLTLTLMEIVLGIDNVIFLAIVAGKLPREQQPRARKIGLTVALGTRLLLLFSLSFLMGLTKPVFTIPELPFLHSIEAREISARDLVLLLGGLFLIYKSTTEIHEKLEADEHAQAATSSKVVSFGKVIFQIAIIDIIFSLDSVITAVGMVDELWVMIVAMVVAMFVMMLFAAKISDFVAKHPTLKMLALSFLILIGVMLVAEGLGQHIDKGYIYFAMAFGVGVEFINLRIRGKHAQLELHGSRMPPEITT